MKKLLFALSLLIAVHASLAQISGTKTIKATGGDYPTLQAAIYDLNLQGVGTGGVTFLVNDGEQFTVNNLTDSLVVKVSGTVDNPIVIKQSANGIKPIINVTGLSAVNGDAVIKLDGADFVKIEGLDFRGDINTEYGIFFSSPLSTNGCRNNIVQNCSVTLDKTNTNRTIGVYLFSGTPAIPDGANKQNKFYNNTVQNCIFGYNFVNNNLTVANYDEENDVGSVDLGTSIITNTGLCGVYLIGQMNCKVYKNKITNIVKADASTAAPAGISTSSSTPSANLLGTVDIYNNEISDIKSSTTSVYGIYFNLRKTTLNFYNNKVYDIQTTSTGSHTANAVELFATSLTANVYNNLIYDISAPSSAVSPTVRGIDARTGSAFNIYYNTVYLKYDAISTANRSVCLYLGGIPCDIRNNVFVNLTSVPTNATTGFAATFFKGNQTYTDISATSDRNLYYAGTPGTNNQHLIFAAQSGANMAYFGTIEAYKTLMSTREQNSISQMPSFTSTVAGSYNFELATQLPVFGQPISTPVSILTDIDGVARDVTNPTIGAYEFSNSGIDTELKTINLSITNYPNPFNNTTTISYSLPNKSAVKIELYNTRGEMVKQLLNDQQNAGLNKLSFNADGLSTGVYYCVITAGEVRVSKSMLFLK